MNKQKLLKALDAIALAIESIKNSINEGNDFDKEVLQAKEAVETLVNESTYTELLANRLAWSYTTMHPEYGLKSQMDNLETMIKGSKISYILNWIRRKGTDGLETFFNLGVEEQRKELLLALTNYNSQIKEVFKKKFSYV